jgi:hypothetical protein
VDQTVKPTRTWRDLAKQNELLLTKAIRQLAEKDAEVERLRAVVDAARHARRIHGNLNLHTAKCQDSPCVVCDDLAEVELDAENELDMALVQLDRAEPQHE